MHRSKVSVTDGGVGLRYPFELISRRMQVQAAFDEPLYTDAIDCARKLTEDWKKVPPLCL